jgi:hypothetical protein
VNQETHGTNHEVYDLTKAENMDGRNRGIELTTIPCATNVSEEDISAEEDLGPKNATGRIQRAEMQ